MKKALALLSFAVLLGLTTGCSKIEIHPEPTFELIGSKDLSLEVGSEWNNDLSSEIVAKELGTNKDLLSNVTVLGEVDIDTPGKYDIEYVLEYGGETYIIKRTVTVNAYKSSDLELVLNGSSTIKVLYMGTFIDPYVVATNLKNGEDITHLVVVDGEVDTTTEGIYTLVYKINYRGVIKTKTRDVQVLEDPGLKLTLSNNSSQYNKYVIGDEYIEHGVNITDNLTGALIPASEVNINGNFDLDETGTYGIEYSVTVRGREYKVIRYIEVVELITNIKFKLESTSERFIDYYSVTYDIADKNKLPEDLTVIVMSATTIYYYEVNNGKFAVPYGAKVHSFIYEYSGQTFYYEV